MFEKADPIAELPRVPWFSVRSGQDWADWLLEASGTAPPRDPAPSARTASAWTALVHLASVRGFTVERESCAAACGFTAWPSRRIRVRPDAAPAAAVAALAHQLGHVQLHEPIAQQLERFGITMCTGTSMIEADSIAYLVTAWLGADNAAITFPSVYSWAGIDPYVRLARAIQTVSDRVLAAAAHLNAQLDTELASRNPGLKPGLAAQSEPSAASRSPQIPRSDLLSIHEAAARFFRARLPRSWVPGYLAGRGFPPTVQQRWQAGYAHHSWDGLTRQLRAEGYPDPLIEAAGLARRSRRGTLADTFRDRAMLPIRSPQGTIIAFIGRAPEHARESVPKYLNSPATDLYDKSEVLFGLWQARGALGRGAQPVITEGPFDAIAVSAACPDRYAGLAPCGAVLTSRQAAALDRSADLRARGVLVAFDADAAGRRAAVKVYHLLTPFTGKTAAVIFPAGLDPAQVLRDHGAAGLRAMLDNRTQPLADLVIDAEISRWSRWLRYPEGQIGALRATAPLIAGMPPPHVARQVTRTASQLGLDHAMVTEAVTDALTVLTASAGATSSAQTVTPPAAPPERHSAATRAGLDSPHSPQQAISQPASPLPVSGQPPKNPPQARLTPGA
jgi:DNA primase catalytic core